jgi:hypothetical protein
MRNVRQSVIVIAVMFAASCSSPGTGGGTSGTSSASGASSGGGSGAASSASNSGSAAHGPACVSISGQVCYAGASAGLCGDTAADGAPNFTNVPSCPTDALLGCCQQVNNGGSVTSETCFYTGFGTVMGLQTTCAKDPNSRFSATP